MASMWGVKPKGQAYAGCAAWLKRAQHLRFTALKALQAYERAGCTPPLSMSELARKVGVMPYELFRAFRVAGGYRRCWEDFLRLLREF